MFRLTQEKAKALRASRSQTVTLSRPTDPLRSQTVTSNQRGGPRYLPYAFTEYVALRDYDLGGVYQLFTSANRVIFIASKSQVAAATESGSGRFFLHHGFFGDGDFWELHDVRDRLGSILTEGRLERQFSVSDLG